MSSISVSIAEHQTRRVEVLRFSALVPENSVKAPPPKFAASRKALSKLCLQICYLVTEASSSSSSASRRMLCMPVHETVGGRDAKGHAL